MRARALLLLAMVSAVGITVGASCRRDEPPGSRSGGDAVGTASVTSAAARASVEEATRRIAAARCEREVTCENVGPSSRHASVETCRGLAAEEIARHLDQTACPKGVDTNKVADCVAVTERAACDDPLRAMMQLEDCRASRLCL